MVENIIELANVEINEFCILNLDTFEIEFKSKFLHKGFTGLYFKDNNTFFALYPTNNGPTIFFENKEYILNKDLKITLKKEGKNRQFYIKEYDIKIDYIESAYIGFDIYSSEIDVDLFCLITERYKHDSFYEQYTV